jgi:hypothetical protein
LQAWASQHTKDGRGVHEYSVDAFDLSPDAGRSGFAFYTDRFPQEA